MAKTQTTFRRMTNDTAPATLERRHGFRVVVRSRQRHSGTVTMTNPHSYKYEGACRDGQAHGLGRLTCPDLNLYEGVWHHGHPRRLTRVKLPGWQRLCRHANVDCVYSEHTTYATFLSPGEKAITTRWRCECGGPSTVLFPETMSLPFAVGCFVVGAGTIWFFTTLFVLMFSNRFLGPNYERVVLWVWTLFLLSLLLLMARSYVTERYPKSVNPDLAPFDQDLAAEDVDQPRLRRPELSISDKAEILAATQAGARFFFLVDRSPGDLGEALQLFRAAAKRGGATAQYLLGVAYYNGDGVTQDRGEAARWLRAAAEQGHADAMKVLGKVEECGVVDRRRCCGEPFQLKSETPQCRFKLPDR